MFSRDYIRRLPKVELHLHLEGAVTAAIFLQLSRKYETAFREWPPHRVAEELFAYEDFYAFLRAYKTVCEHLCEPADYVSVLESLSQYFAEQNIRYAEIIYTPSIPWRFGRNGEEVLAALLEKSEQIGSRDGVGVRWILDCVRQWGRGPAEQTAQLAYKWQSRGVVALGLGGDENSLPMQEYREVFSWAKAHQLYAHVHAGEIGGPEQVWEAVRALGANRIGHGIQSARDPSLMEYLREHAIPLDVCLTSNGRTGAWRGISNHPFQLLLKRGVHVTLSTDDPGLFQTSLTEEYCKAVGAAGLSLEDLHRIVLQGVHSSFLPREEKMKLMQQFQGELHRLGRQTRASDSQA